jgi:TonB family protein
MEDYYPIGPESVPEDLAAPSKPYRRHAWMATLGLLLFITAYFSLAIWFGWTGWRILSGLGNAGDGFLWSLVAGVSAMLLAIFMLKALFFIQRGKPSGDIEVTAAQEPVLFAFLGRLADDVGAPRPLRVYVSGGVNAAVFYDLSLANLFIPSHKNLEIGLGLVNVLTLGELKAVLAHEFGHFAQRTMAVGRWVYIAQQIAGHVVARRDAFDRFLATLSPTDLRIAWIGWVLRLIVWSIRSLVDLLFRVVVLAQRALSREMEFQADLVSVAVTGSDALIHALHRLAAADDAWNRTLAFAADEQRANRPVKDLFAVQTKVIANIREILNDPEYGAEPSLAPGESTRVFKAAVAAPPQMWATHPSNSDREENAKRLYVASAIDGRSAWSIFTNAQELRECVSRHLIGKVEATPVPTDETLSVLDAQYHRSYLDRRYRGSYLGRTIVRHARTVQELYGSVSAVPHAAFGDLYPESLSHDIERLRELEQEKGLLSALRRGTLTAPGGVIRHRGQPIARKALPAAIEAVQKEIDAVGGRVHGHDQLCRTMHLAVASTVGKGWADYLKGLLALHHYADHVEANLRDAQALLVSTVNFALSDGNVSKSDLQHILTSADTAYAALKDVHDQASQVVADGTVLARIGKESWRDSLEQLRLPPPSNQNMGDWLKFVHGWIASTCASLSTLRLASLEQLLVAEAQVAAASQSQQTLADAPPNSKVPREYRLLMPGSERPKTPELDWWERFVTANGAIPAAARLLVAGGIVGLVLWIGTSVGGSSVQATRILERGDGADIAASARETLIHNRDLWSAFLAHNHLPENTPHDAAVITAESSLTALISKGGPPTDDWVERSRALNKAYIDERREMARKMGADLSTVSGYRKRISTCPEPAVRTSGKDKPRPGSSSRSLADFYPRALRISGVEGLVVISVKVNSSGCGVEAAVAVSSGSNELDDAALSWVETASFLPAEKDAKPIDGVTLAAINFTLDPPSAPSAARPTGR